MKNNEATKTKAERREEKKTRRKFRIHGKSLSEIYRNVILKRLRGKTISLKLSVLSYFAYLTIR